jgi:hypothetical protein
LVKPQTTKLVTFLRDAPSMLSHQTKRALTRAAVAVGVTLAAGFVLAFTVPACWVLKRWAPEPQAKPETAA